MWEDRAQTEALWRLLQSADPDEVARGRTALAEARALSLSAAQLAALPPLPALRALTLTVSPLSTALPPLPFPALERLVVRSGTGLTDIRTLRPLTALESLSLWGCRQLRDLSPLAGLGALRELNLARCPRLGSLAPLRHLARLEVLDLTRSRVPDLAALDMLPQLRRIHLADVPLDDPAPLRRLPALAPPAGPLVTIGRAEVASLYAPGALSGATYLSLRGRWELVDLSPLADAPGLEGLELARCRRLRDLWPVALLPALRLLDVRGCDALTVPPPVPFMDRREPVARYQRALAQALAEKADRTPEEDGWLAQMQALGLLAPLHPPPLWTQEAAICDLLEGEDPAQVRQGLWLLESLGDAALLEAVSWGMGLSPEGHLTVAGRHRRMFRQKRRIWLTLAMLGLRGDLARAERLIVAGAPASVDLEPLRTARQLRVLHIGGDLTFASLSALGGLEHLEELSLGHLRNITPADLAPLATLPALRVLRLTGRLLPRETWGPHQGRDRVQQALAALLR